jgi:hypothetical protein
MEPNASLHLDDVVLCVHYAERRLELGIIAHQVGPREELISGDIRRAS